MNQKELLKAIVEELAEKGIQITQADVKEVLSTVEEVVDNAILNGQVVKVLGCKFQTVEKPETSGVTKLGGEEKSWTKPAHLAAKCSYLPTKKKSLEREI